MLKITKESFKYIILLFFIFLFVLLFLLKSNFRKSSDLDLNSDLNNKLMVFVQDGCLHCKNAEKFLNENADKFKDIDVVFYNIKNNEAQVLLFKNISKLKIPQENIGTPIFIMNNKYIVGFGENEKSNLIELLNEKKIK